MRNIFKLTKREQRIVVAIIMALVVFAFAKHLFQKQPEPAPATTTSAASPTLPPSKDKSESDDLR